MHRYPGTLLLPCILLASSVGAQAADRTPEQCKAFVNKSPELVFDTLGKAADIRRVGSEGGGMVVEWVYPKCVFTLKRVKGDGQPAYKIAAARPNRGDAPGRAAER